MSIKIHPSWQEALKGEFKKPYFNELTEFVREEYKRRRVYPSPKNIFRAFDLCPFDKVKVVILGQDPYHGPSQANGLCFSVYPDVDIPPSLRNIYKELHNDLGVPYPQTGELEKWAKQGVLLLNATLTVLPGIAGSHQGKGWETFTDAVVQALSDQREDLVFILWGRYAKNKGQVIDRKKHHVLEAPHPSPLSAHRGFFGSKPFSKSNAFLEKKGKKPVKW